jgi:hypothetical protein
MIRIQGKDEYIVAEPTRKTKMVTRNLHFTINLSDVFCHNAKMMTLSFNNVWAKLRFGDLGPLEELKVCFESLDLRVIDPCELGALLVHTKPAVLELEQKLLGVSG